MQINLNLSISQNLNMMSVFEEISPPDNKIQSYRSTITRLNNEPCNLKQFTVRNGKVIRLNDLSDAAKARLLKQKETNRKKQI